MDLRLRAEVFAGIALSAVICYNKPYFLMNSGSPLGLGGSPMKKHKWTLAVLLVMGLLLSAGLAVYADYYNGAGEYVLTEGSHAILITELCSKNETVIADNAGRYRDYIELYNAGEAANLQGFTLTDGKATSAPFGDTPMAAGEYRIFFLGDDITGFGIGASGGDCIQLLDPNGSIVAQVTAAALTEDQVMHYHEGLYQVSDAPSPGFENSDAGLAAFRQGIPVEAPVLVISELLIGNTSALADEKGNFGDIVELQNASDAPVWLGNYFLSDSMENRFTFRLPDLYLEPGGYLVIYCDGEAAVGEDGQLHANFGLTHGETLVLTDRSGGYVSLTAEYLGENVSAALQADGSWSESSPSPGYANDEAGIARFASSRTDPASALVIHEVLLSSAGVPWEGEFRDVVEIRNRSENTVSTAGWYLSDGSDPYDCPLPPQQLEPGACLVMVCGPETTGFSLSEGETLRLMGPDCLFAPTVTCTEGEPGMSISLLSGTDAAYGPMAVTLGYANEEENYTLFLESRKPKSLVISELMSANRSYLPGPYGTTADWIELYNGSDKNINLSDYRITDDTGNLEKYALPNRKLAPGEYCVLLLSKDATNLPEGYPVLPFALSSEGEQLYLSRDGIVEDYAQVPSLSPDISWGRTGNSARMTLLAEPTPGEVNAGAVEMSVMPAAAIPQGVYDSVEYLDVALLGEGEIYYTTDCEHPSEEGIRYTGPIRLTETTVIRAVCREKGKLESQVLTLAYLINENDSLPVVSVVAEPDDLFDEYTGMYTKGPNASSAPPYFGANYWMDWERPASISLFETDGSGFTASCGIKIFGAYTRSLPKKSLACMFRDSYGDGELRYPLFGESSLDTYESIILRSAGQDAFQARMRDVLVTSLIGEATDMAVQQYKPVVVYLNGQYWGLHYIREKLNENYVAGHYNVTPDWVTFLEDAGWRNQDYRALIDYVMEHDMRRQEHYDYVCSKIDVDSYLDFYLAQMWIANTDNGNVKYFRIDDGKWTWCMFDTDLSFLEYSLDTVKDGLDEGTLDKTDLTGKAFAARMIHNEAFREKFLTRLAWQMNNIWTEDNILARISEIEAQIGEDLKKDCERWGYRYTDWQTHVERVRTFARERNAYMLKYVQSYFGLTDEEMRAYGFAV